MADAFDLRAGMAVLHAAETTAKRHNCGLKNSADIAHSFYHLCSTDCDSQSPPAHLSSIVHFRSQHAGPCSVDRDRYSISITYFICHSHVPCYIHFSNVTTCKFAVTI